MNVVTVSELAQHVGQDVELKGWVYNTRSVGKIWFLILRDGTGILQCVVVKDETDDDSFTLEQDLNQEDSVTVTGTVREEPRALGGFELGVCTINVVSHVADEYPISHKDHGTDFLMSNRNLWLR